MGSQTGKRPLKLLIIAPYCIVPAETGGKIRVSELAHGVSAQGIKVTVVMPITPALMSRRSVNENLTLEVVPYPFLLPLLLTDKPFSYLYLISLHPGYGLFIRNLLRSHDIIQFEGACFGDLIRAIEPDKKVVYDAHNVEYDYALAEASSPWVRRLSSRRVYQLERSIAQRADSILTCSHADTQRIRDLYNVDHDKLTVAPNGIHLNKKTVGIARTQVAERFPGMLDFPVRAIFTGSDVEHNRVAVRFLVESVASQLSEQCAFIIKGQCAKRFQDHHLNNVFLDPIPGNVGTYADICTVAVNPVTQGSGTSLKVLDYLAHRLPLISTPFGMRGFEDLERFVTLCDLEGFTKTLNTKPSLLPGLDETLEKYTWTSIAESVSDVYQSLVV